MAVWLKKGSVVDRDVQDRKVRDTVEAMLRDVQERGNEAVREILARHA